MNYSVLNYLNNKLIILSNNWLNVGVGKKSNFLDPIHFYSNPIHL